MKRGSTSAHARSREIPRLALVMALAVSSACAEGSAPGRVDAGRASPLLLEDTGSNFYEEHEVDVPARPVRPLEPVYPPRLRALGVEGEAEARMAVLSDGSAAGARLVKSTHDEFTAAVREALREARFHPALRRGKPVSSWMTVRLSFRIEK